MTDESYKPFAETRSATVVADIALCLINQVNFLLDQRIRQLEQVFLQEGGLHERMTRARLQSRNQNH